MTRVERDLFHTPAPVADPGALTLTSLGTAGFVVTAAGTDAVIDPYVSRHSLAQVAVRRLRPDVDAIDRWVPRADAVLVGHAHYDHVLDAPHVCRRDGAPLVGSPAVGMVGRAAGLPDDQLVTTEGHEDLTFGSLTVRGLPSRHGKVFGRVPYPGDITEPPPWPPRARHLRHGLVLSWWLRGGATSVVHVDSADFVDDELADVTCDVLCLCAIGRQSRAGYTTRAVELLQPRWVVPCHWDWFFSPLRAMPAPLPTVDLEGFADEIRATGAEPVLLRVGDRWSPPG